MKKMKKYIARLKPTNDCLIYRA